MLHDTFLVFKASFTILEELRLPHPSYYSCTVLSCYSSSECSFELYVCRLPGELELFRELCMLGLQDHRSKDELEIHEFRVVSQWGSLATREPRDIRPVQSESKALPWDPSTVSLDETLLPFIDDLPRRNAKRSREPESPE